LARLFFGAVFFRVFVVVVVVVVVFWACAAITLPTSVIDSTTAINRFMVSSPGKSTVIDCGKAEASAISGHGSSARVELSA